MITATITPLGLGVFLAVGLVLAVVKDVRDWHRKNQRIRSERQRLWAQLRERGYTVIPYSEVGLYGSLLADDPWNQVLISAERASSATVRTTAA